MTATRHLHRPVHVSLAVIGALTGALSAAAQDAPPPRTLLSTPTWPQPQEMEPVPSYQSDKLFRGPSSEVLDGVSLHASVITDFSAGIKGGVNSDGTAFRHLFDLSLSLDFDQLFGIKGGTFFIAFQNEDGESGSERITGDLQGFDNIDEDSFTEISELWYEQYQLNRHVRIKVGKVDANAEFAATSYAPVFVHSAPYYSPTIYLLPTYPDPAMGINIFLYPDESTHLGLGFYDGSLAQGVSTGSQGPSTFFDNPGAWFWIAEAGISWGDGRGELPGRILAGAWLNTSDIDRFDGVPQDDTFGYYALIEQALWRADPTDPDDDRGVGMYLQYGWAEEDVSEFVQHVGGGIAMTGPLPGRDRDIVGLGASYVELSDAAGAGFTEDYELAIETFYRVQVGQYVTVQPDLQYIFNPGGDASIPDSFVFTLRVEVGF